MKTVVAVIAGVAAAFGLARGEAAGWVGTWGASPVPPGPAGTGPGPGTPSFDNQTLRQVVRVSVGGERLRIRFTNEYGTHPLRIGAVTLARLDAHGAPVPGTERTLHFSGQTSAVIPAEAPLLSDPVDLAVPALSSVSISLYLPQDTGPCTCHPVALQSGSVSGPGDFTAGSFPTQTPLRMRAFISGVEVESAHPQKAIVAFGDSITDGVGSTADQNRRWPDKLAERLAAADPSHGWGVVNMAISGNRVLDDGAGQSALARFDRDVLSVSGAAYVIVFEGVNDLGLSFGHPQGPFAERFRALAPAQPANAQAMIAGYRQLIERAHAKGVKIFGATIAPYEGAVYWSPEGEAQRQAINTWIRTGGDFDGVLDFDAALRDPAQPSRMRAELQAGDHLHGSDAGYEAIARSIDLKRFR